MKAYTKLLLLFAAAFTAFASYCHAQVTTLSTTAYYANSTSQISGSATVGEVFTSISAINSFTYNFFTSTSTSSSLQAQWAVYDGTGSMDSLSNWTTLVDFGTLNIAGFTSANTNGWTTLTNANGTFNTYTATFDFGGFYATNSSLTYALLLTNTSSSGAGVSLGYSTDKFADGSASVGFALTGFGSFADYTFSNIVYVKAGDSIPVTATPEPASTAALAGAALAAGLVSFRVRQQRKLALVPVTTTAA